MTALKQKNLIKQSPLDILQSVLGDDMKAVNAIILDNMQSDVALIPRLASYLIASGGKRIRPLLTLTATQICGGDMGRAHLLSACVEFIHTATLLHDDVVDGSDQRRGKQAANRVFGNEASVLVGDFLFSRAFQLMVQDGSLDVLRILSGASAIIAEGEVAQLVTQNNLDTTIDDYLKVIEGKTASLFAAACEVGPVIAGDNESTQAAFRDYGMALGMAFQIADDVLDYSKASAKLGKDIGDDFREGKMTAPILFALESAHAINAKDELAFWQRTLGDLDQKEGDLDTAMDYLNKHNAIDQGIKLSIEQGARAKLAIANIEESKLKSALIDLVDFSIHRKH